MATGGHFLSLALATCLKSQPLTAQSLASIPSSVSICVWEKAIQSLLDRMINVLWVATGVYSYTHFCTVIQWRLYGTLTLMELPNPTLVHFTQTWLLSSWRRFDISGTICPLWHHNACTVYLGTRYCVNSVVVQLLFKGQSKSSIQIADAYSVQYN